MVKYVLLCTQNTYCLHSTDLIMLCLWQLFTLVADGFFSRRSSVKERTRWAREIFVTFLAQQAVSAVTLLCCSVFGEDEQFSPRNLRFNLPNLHLASSEQ